MSENSAISWTHHTWNPWMGCDKVAPECAHCYIDRVMIKQGRQPWGQIYHTSEANWRKPLAWEKKAAKRDRALRVFTCSESDFFHDKADDWRAQAWEIIKSTPHLTYQILTKRPGRILHHLPPDWGEGYNNVWLGVTAGCVNSMVQIDKLRQVPAFRRFVSAEPLLEDISSEINLDGIDWLIAGGESGPGPEYVWIAGTDFKTEQKGRRTMALDSAEKLRDACEQLGTIFYFKQITAYRSGTKPDALGKLYHSWPSAPFPWYSAADLEADFAPKPSAEKENAA